MLIVTGLVVVVCRFAFEKGNDNLVKPVDTVGRIEAHAPALRGDSGALPVPEDHDYSFRNRDVMWIPADIEFTWPFRLLQRRKAKGDVSPEQPHPPW
jgi:hypothetical protein